MAVADWAALPTSIATAPAREHLGCEVMTFAAAEPIWRDLERDGIATPYQRFAFASAYAGALSEAEIFEPCAVVVRGVNGRPLLVLPLSVLRRAGLRIARPLGGRQANYHLPLMAAWGRVDPPALRRALMEAGRELRIDAYQFFNMPLSWSGAPNPLLGEDIRPSASSGWKLTLDPDPEVALARVLSGKTRRKLRQKEKSLAALGALTYEAVECPESAAKLLETYFMLKAERFAALGIHNPFDCQAVQAFLQAGCRKGLAEGRPAIELYALTVGDRLAALYGGTGDRTCFSGMIVAFDPDPAIARCSPGDLLLNWLVQEQCRRGRTMMDLGVGEARYKTAVCNEEIPLADLTIPLTWRGLAFAFAAGSAGTAKRFVKRTPWAWSLVQRARRLHASG